MKWLLNFLPNTFNLLEYSNWSCNSAHGITVFNGDSNFRNSKCLESWYRIFLNKMHSMGSYFVLLHCHELMLERRVIIYKAVDLTHFNDLQIYCLINIMNTLYTYRVSQNCGTICNMQYPDAKRHRKVFYRFKIRGFDLEILNSWTALLIFIQLYCVRGPVSTRASRVCVRRVTPPRSAVSALNCAVRKVHC